MNVRRAPWGRTIGSRAAVRRLFPILLMCLCVTTGCFFPAFPCAHSSKFLLLRAQVVDAETGVGLTDASIGGFFFTGGDITSSRNPAGPVGNHDLLPPDEEGRFDLTFFSPELGAVCGITPFVRTVFDPEFPPPDQIELIVIRGSCEQRFTINVNEDTVVDMTFPEDVIELKDPILVPPCVE